MHTGSGTEYVCVGESQDIRATTKTSNMKLLEIHFQSALSRKCLLYTVIHILNNDHVHALVYFTRNSRKKIYVSEEMSRNMLGLHNI